MCLVTSKRTKVKIAKEDITCYKIVMELKSYRGNPTCVISAIKNFIYKFNELYTTTLKHKLFTSFYMDCFDDMASNAYIGQNPSSLIVYTEGFHSLASINRSEAYMSTIGVLVECTIPKGTKYINDKTGLLCSEGIIVNKIIKTCV